MAIILMEARLRSSAVLRLLWILALSGLFLESMGSGEGESVVEPTPAATNPRIVEHPENQYVVRGEPATLNCKAEGEPPPIITWYRDGQPVTTANENPASHRMILPSGQLFFLRIINNKNSRPDVGVYYCNATNPETRRSVISRNATLEIAGIGTEFREQPQSTDVNIGVDALLDCKPPKGEPEPRVRWRKDGEPVKLGDRLVLLDSGSLKIRGALREDAGQYVCIAFNIAGEKESSPARISVREKPRIIEGPKDVVVQENSDVSFNCRATGDPEPTIIWKKADDTMPQGRLQIHDDRSLKIERTRSSDEGVYICRAENSVGWHEAEAKLTVHSQPSFVVTPKDKTVGVGRRVVMRCEVTGNPLPAVFWNKESSQTLMFPNQDHGRMSVSDDGTLVIEPVQKEDAGEYVCKGLSVAGSAYAKARLEVKEIDSRPAPIIHQIPQNQTLPVSSVALLQCAASGEPPPIIRWLRNNRPLPARDPRFTILDSGTLQISDLRKADSGVYTCKAVSETGETSWRAALAVEAPTNPSVIFHRTPEPSTFPGPPSKPSISDVTETSVRLSWRSNNNPGASPIIGYTAEYFSHETGEGWIVASDEITEPTYVLRGLRPDTAYMFLVRAQNSHGLSLPSLVTSPIRTKGAGISPSRPAVPALDLGQVADKLSGQIVNMLPAEVLSSTAVKLSWEIRKNHRFIEGFHIRYRAIPFILSAVGLDQDDLNTGRYGQEQKRQAVDSSSFGNKDYSVETVQSSSTTMYTLSGLDKNTYYEMSVQPFYLSVIGQDSNTVRIKTLEDVPSAAPDNVRARMVDNTTLYVSWEAPPKQHHNGALRGYKIYIYGNESRFDREIQLNSSSLSSVYINQMVADMTYKIQMSAYNRVGEGIRSDQFILGPQTSSLKQALVREPWFIASLIGAIGGVLWILLCIFSVWLYRKRRAGKKLAAKTEAEPMRTNADYLRSNGGMFGNTNQPNYQEKSQGPSMRYNYQSVDTEPAPYNSGKQPIYSNQMSSGPYAITDLAENATFLPIHQSYIIMQQQAPPQQMTANASSNDSSCLKNDISGNESNSSGRCVTNADDNRSQPEWISSAQPILFLPPPPEHPPPSDIGTPPDSPTVDHQASRYTSSPRYHSADDDHSYNAGIDNRRQQQMMDRYGSFNPRMHGGNDAFQSRYPNGSRLPVAAAQQQRTSQSQSSTPRSNTPRSGNECPSAFRLPDCNVVHGNGVINDRQQQRRDMLDNGPPPRPPVRSAMLQGASWVGDGNGYPRHLSGPDVPPLYPGLTNESAARFNPLWSNGIEGGRSPPESTISEVDPRDYNDLESDLDLSAVRGGVEEHDSPDSCSDDDLTRNGMDDDCAASWEGDGSSIITGGEVGGENSDCSTVNSSAVSEEEEEAAFLAEADFASAVARAAQLSGLTVIGSTVTKPAADGGPAGINGTGRERPKKPSKHRQRARASSPYSTDSNYSDVAALPHKPYPKSDRRRQLREHGSRSASGGANGAGVTRADMQSPRRPSDRIQQDITMLNHMNYVSGSGVQPGHPIGLYNNDVFLDANVNSVILPTKSIDRDASERINYSNPLSAFNIRNTPVV